MSSYSIVVATRNRADVLAVSLKLFLNQSVTPEEIIIVDASDDHDAVRRHLDEVGVTADRMRVRKADQGNLAAQRNQGLAEVTTPIVMFPDDDSYWFQDTAAMILDVYDRDQNQAIGGVTAIEVPVSPLAGNDVSAPTKRGGLSQLPSLRWLRHRLENAIVPQPFHLFGARQTARLRAGLDMTDRFDFVETIGGYRMSFRTETVRRLSFDADLGRHVGYSQHEDKDMGLRVLAGGQLLAVAPSARVFHNVYPALRTKGGFEYGFCQIANYAYIVAKTMAPNDPARRALGRFLRYKTTLYGLRVRQSAYLCDVSRGARAAMSEVGRILAATADDQRATYLDAMNRHVG